MASNWVKVKTKPIRNPKSTLNGILTNPRCLDAENHVKGSSYSVHQTAAHSGGSRREAWKEALLRHAAADRREQVGGRAEAPAAEHLRQCSCHRLQWRNRPLDSQALAHSLAAAAALGTGVFSSDSRDNGGHIHTCWESVHYLPSGHRAHYGPSSEYNNFFLQ